jgi:cobalt-zinc-cadmium efflux system outer membrane protein
MTPHHPKERILMKQKRGDILTVGLAIFALFLSPLRSVARQSAAPQAPPSSETPGRQVQPGLTLDDLEKMALAHNPTLAQASAQIREAQGRELQSGLYPNPTAGYIGEQIRGGVERGGEQGFFVQQDIVLGGKLGLNRRIFEQERLQANEAANEQRIRVTTAVQIYFIRALAAQETVNVRRRLLQLATEATGTSHQLFNVGEADRPDVLAAEVEQQQAQLAFTVAEEQQNSVWQNLAAIAGVPDLPPQPLQGNLESFGSLDEGTWLNRMLQDSPAVKIAEIGVARAEATLALARRQPVPDLQIRAGLEQNRELSEFSGQPMGLQGFAQAGVQIPIFNRNQGNVAAATAQIDLARQEVDRVRLELRQEAAPVFRNYQTAREAVQLYKTQMIPRAQEAYNLYLQSYRNMAAAYPQVLIAQRTLFQLEDAYIAALEQLGTSSITLKSFLLTGGLQAPGQMEQGGFSGEVIGAPPQMMNTPSSGQ